MSRQETGHPPGELTAALLESLQNDFRSLAVESKKKYPLVKEACEEAIAKLKSFASSSSGSSSQANMYYLVNQIIFPISQGCESKDVKLIKVCLQIIQKLITNQLIDQKGAVYITNTLWALMEMGIEEVKILQSVILLLTTNTVVHGETLAKTLVLCFRLHFAKNSTTINTAGAAVRQLVYLVFERVVAEDEQLSKIQNKPEKGSVNFEELKGPTGAPPKGLPLCAGDAYLLFQDLVQLVNGEQPYWLIGMTEMTRTFGLALIESILTQFSFVFYKNPEFTFLLKERVCALIIKLFSPNIKYRNNMPMSIQQATFEKPYFPISMRLLRVVSVLIEKYHELLVTECEIFLSLIVKFLDPDKPAWQRALALEVLHKMTIQPNLLVSFCECYDLNAHTTSIFQDIVNSLGAYVQSLFVNQQMQMGSGMGMPLTQPQQPIVLGGLTAGPGVSPQPGFLLRGVWLPIVITLPTGQTKSTYMDMLEKVEPPVVPDGYGVSVAYACLMEIVRSLQIIINPQKQPDEKTDVEVKKDSETKKVTKLQLINSSWCGLLAALTPLVEASTDEAITENILKSIQMYTCLCGILELTTPRDAFITAICKSSLPPHYALTVLNQVSSSTTNQTRHSPMGEVQNILMHYGDNDFRQQVVAVGTPLPTTAVPAGTQQGPVMLTSKNLQSMRALLSLAHCHGTILGSAWHLVLTTLQHLVWILGLKPSTGGSLKAGRTTVENNAVITTSVMADLPVLSQMLSRLFESSQYLDDVSLHHLINALCKLSQEAMELAFANREPSLFAVAKLLETGLVNMTRIEVLWRPVTNHLLEVCHHPHIRMREWGVEAVTYLVKASLHYKHAIPLKDNQKLQTLLLGPLYELSNVPRGDVRQRQLECVLQILHSNGETLSHGWPLILGIIGAVNEQHGENLIRIAFQCLQLVITDFLPAMPWKCLPQCVDTVAKFGSQTQELNISLTAVGLMWNISDYFNQNQGKLSHTVGQDLAVLPDFPGTVDMPSFDKLWMCLYARLGELCVDSRPAVRKSAGQTLFSTISAHGSLLKPPTWQVMIWQVLFPLLDNVRKLSNSASSEKVDAGGNILIHHSRNTAQKQWAETQVLTLSSLARVFNTKRTLLHTLGDFPRAWSILLDFIENAALSKNNEVSVAALKSFQEVLFLTKFNTNKEKEEKEIWDISWKIWLKIGAEVTTVPKSKQNDHYYLPSQTFLTALVQIFPSVFQHIKNNFSLEDLKQLGLILTNVVNIPVVGEPNLYIMSVSSDLSVLPLHDGVLHALELVQKEILHRNHSKMIPELFKLLLTFSKLTCSPPDYSRYDSKQESKVSDWPATNHVPFGEKATTMLVKLYEKTADNPDVINAGILSEIISTLHTPLSLKYDCPSASVWKLAATGLISVLKVGLKVARSHGNQFSGMWKELGATLNAFLFHKNCASAGGPGEKGLDQMVSDEIIDCQMIEILRTEVLPYSSLVPKEFIMQVVILLNKGSIHSATTVKNEGEMELTLREDFAKTCFETLLQFSLIDGDYNKLVITNEDDKNNDIAGQLAVTSLLHRFQEVLKKYIEDEKLSGKCPLPRYRLSEISFVLKALTTLIISMKKTTLVTEDYKAWEQLICLYPYLVECTTTSSTQVSRPLKEALLQFCDLLQPPNIKKPPTG